MSTVDKEVALLQIKKLMEENSISIIDIPEGNKLNRTLEIFKSTNTNLWDIAKQLKDKIYDLIDDEQEAYDWFEENFSSDWRTDLDVFPPHRYSIIKCTKTFLVAVPDSYRTAAIEDLADDCSEYESWDFEEIEDNIREKSIDSYSYVNDTDELDWDN